jgi:hypothetical protein
LAFQTLGFGCVSLQQRRGYKEMETDMTAASEWERKRERERDRERESREPERKRERERKRRERRGRERERGQQTHAESRQRVDGNADRFDLKEWR